ncbi:MAG TPA: CDP-diacylglycerol--serine O-phosphatidyltransferase [Candidatus Lokiarchaeia archaeon]
MSSIPKLLKLKDYITLIGTTLGIVAIICAVIGTRFFVSLGFFLVSITLGTDLLDGYIARKTGTVNKFGIELDSLSDSLTFGIAPSILIYQGFRSGTIYDYILIIGCVCFSLCAILRLARFNVITEERPGYIGLPTPLSCIMITVFFYANHFYALGLGGLDYPFPYLSYYLLPIILVLIGWFNITRFIEFKKKGKAVYIIVSFLTPLVPILGIVGLLYPNYIVCMIISVVFLISFIILNIYVLTGFFNKTSKNEKKE